MNPKGAKVLSAEQRTRLKNDHRYVEEYLPIGKPLYVLGYLDTRDRHPANATLHRQMGSFLTTWKADSSKLLQRFDANSDGKIDLLEWEKARHQARQQVELQHQMHGHMTDTFTLAKHAAGKLFLISVLSPQNLRHQYLAWSLLYLGFVIVLLAAYVRLR